MFDELKFHKERSKYELCAQTNLEEDATIQVINQTTNQVKDRSKHKQLVKAVKKGVVYPFGRFLHQFFTHWKNINDEYKHTLHNKIKLRIIKSYHNKLQEAFDNMKTKGATKTRKKRMVMT